MNKQTELILEFWALKDELELYESGYRPDGARSEDILDRNRCISQRIVEISKELSIIQKQI